MDTDGMNRLVHPYPCSSVSGVIFIRVHPCSLVLIRVHPCPALTTAPTVGMRRHTFLLIEARYMRMDMGEYPMEGAKVYLTVSIGEAFEGFCYKLVAGVILDTDKDRD